MRRRVQRLRAVGYDRRVPGITDARVLAFLPQPSHCAPPPPSGPRPLEPPIPCTNPRTAAHTLDFSLRFQSNAEYMREHCTRSCGHCPEEPCVDEEAACPAWAKGGFCTSNADYMSKSCRKACGLCGNPPPDAGAAGASCVDKHRKAGDCAKWAANGQCEGAVTSPKVPCHATGLPFAPSPFTPPLASLFPGIGRPLPKLLVVAPSQPTPSTWRTSAGARATSARTSAETCCQTVTRGSATHSARATGASWRSTASERAAGAGPRGRSRRRACAPTRTSSARTGLSWASARRTRSSWGASARAPATLARGAALQARALAAGPRAQLRLRPRLRRRFRAWTTIGGARRGRPRAGASPTRVSCGRRAPWRVGHAIITHSLLRGGVPLRCRGRGGDARTRPWRAAIARAASNEIHQSVCTTATPRARSTST